MSIELKQPAIRYIYIVYHYINTQVSRCVLYPLYEWLQVVQTVGVSVDLVLSMAATLRRSSVTVFPSVKAGKMRRGAVSLR